MIETAVAVPNVGLDLATDKTAVAQDQVITVDPAEEMAHRNLPDQITDIQAQNL